MKRMLNNQSGSALAMTLIVMLVLMIFGTALLNLSVADNKFANRNEDKLQAYYIARAGAQTVADYIMADGESLAYKMIGGTSTVNTQIAGGTVQVAVSEVSGDVIITATGTYKGITQTAKVKLVQVYEGNEGGFFDYALLAEETIARNNNGNGNPPDIKGKIGTKSNNGFNGSGVSYNPSDVYDNVNVELYDISVPNNAISLGSVQTGSLPRVGDVSQKSVNGVNQYYYSATSIDVGNGGNKTLAVTSGIAHIFVSGTVTFSANSIISIAENSKLYIYVIGNGKVTFEGKQNTKNLFIYAPDSVIEFNNAQGNNSTTEFVGGLVGKSIQLFQGSIIKPDPSLRDYFYNYGVYSNIGINYGNPTWID